MGVFREIEGLDNYLLATRAACTSWKTAKSREAMHQNWSHNEAVMLLVEGLKTFLTPLPVRLCSVPWSVRLETVL